jgi:hypothetical protein
MKDQGSGFYVNSLDANKLKAVAGEDDEEGGDRERGTGENDTSECHKQHAIV